MGQREQRDEQADGAGAQHQDPLPRPQRRAPERAQGAAARLDQRARDLVDHIGQRVQRGDRHGHPLGERAGEAAPDPDLVPGLAHVRPAAPAASARAAAQHGVAGGAPAHPARVDVVADGADGSAPLVAEPHRVRGVALMQVSHLTGEELDIGAAHADALDVDDHLPPPRYRIGNLGDLSPARAGDDERSHRASGSRLLPGSPKPRSRVSCGDISRC
jgi:hypothetical protein